MPFKDETSTTLLLPYMQVLVNNSFYALIDKHLNKDHTAVDKPTLPKPSAVPHGLTLKDVLCTGACGQRLLCADR